MALTSVATAVWNQIAETQKLKTAWAKKAFALNPEEMQQAEDKEGHGQGQGNQDQEEGLAGGRNGPPFLPRLSRLARLGRRRSPPLFGSGSHGGGLPFARFRRRRA